MAMKQQSTAAVLAFLAAPGWDAKKIKIASVENALTISANPRAARAVTTVTMVGTANPMNASPAWITRKITVKVTLTAAEAPVKPNAPMGNPARKTATAALATATMEHAVMM